MTDAAWHALIIVSFLLVGVPSNVAIVWIHTRKNSRVAKNRFPLIFAAIDLFALFTTLTLIQYAFETGGRSAPNNIYLNASLSVSLNGYLTTLFMATVDKFYAVMFPFKYGKKRATIFKITIAATTVPNAVLSIAIPTSYMTIGGQSFRLMLAIYNVAFALMFLATTILYSFIIAKIIRNRRNLEKVNNHNG